MTKRLAAAVALAVALANLAASPPALAAAPESVGQLSSLKLAELDSGPILPAARDLAELLVPRDKLRQLMMHSASKAMDSSPDFALIEKASPGALAEMKREVLKDFGPIADRRIERGVNRYARLFGRAFDREQMAVLSHFYASATGRKVIAVKYAQIAVALGDEDVLSSEEPLTSGQVRQLNREVASRLVEKLDADDMAAFAVLAKSSAFARMKALSPTLDRIEADQGNERDPELEQVTIAAVERVIARRKLN